MHAGSTANKRLVISAVLGAVTASLVPMPGGGLESLLHSSTCGTGACRLKRRRKWRVWNARS
jgi:hypothetical protein